MLMLTLCIMMFIVQYVQKQAHMARTGESICVQRAELYFISSIL